MWDCILYYRYMSVICNKLHYVKICGIMIDIVGHRDKYTGTVWEPIQDGSLLMCQLPQAVPVNEASMSIGGTALEEHANLIGWQCHVGRLVSGRRETLAAQFYQLRTDVEAMLRFF